MKYFNKIELTYFKENELNKLNDDELIELYLLLKNSTYSSYKLNIQLNKVISNLNKRNLL